MPDLHFNTNSTFLFKIHELSTRDAPYRQVHFLVHLMPRSTSEEGQQQYQFALSVNSTNAEDGSTGGDNELSLSLPIRIHTELILSG